jgi:hypothetical protein
MCGDDESEEIIARTVEGPCPDMKPLFTVHAGEYLVGSYIEQHYKHARVWIPSRDTGVDLLVSDRRGRSTVSIQVKFGKDYLPTAADRKFRKKFRVSCWFALNRAKLKKSEADFWVFVLNGFKSQTPDYVVIPVGKLRERLRQIHGAKPERLNGTKSETIHTYLTVTEENQCWETRDLTHGKADEHLIADGVYKKNLARDFTKWLNAWDPMVKKLNR